jgi:hypothetical protein
VVRFYPTTVKAISRASSSKMTSSTEIHTGDIGEALCYYRLLQMGVPCRIVNLGATDILAILDDDVVIRVQVKTAHQTFDPRYKNRSAFYGFNVCRGSKEKRRFLEHEIDVFACVGLEDESIIFYQAKHLLQKKTHKVKAHLFSDSGVTQDSWSKAIKPLLYT